MNIKLVHILLDPNDSQDIPKENWESTVNKQKGSRDYWESVKHKFTSILSYGIMATLTFFLITK